MLFIAELKIWQHWLYLFSKSNVKYAYHAFEEQMYLNFQKVKLDF